MKPNRRSEIDAEEFDLKYLQKMMRNLFPKKNDCCPLSELAEVVGELKTFSIRTKLQVRLFLKKHRRVLLEVEAAPLDKINQRIYREDMGDTEYLDRVRRQYWYCYPGLVRTAMEVEFGQTYEDFARKRDAI
jgi:hypothetical protein